MLLGGGYSLRVTRCTGPVRINLLVSTGPVLGVSAFSASATNGPHGGRIAMGRGGEWRTRSSVRSTRRLGVGSGGQLGGNRPPAADANHTPWLSLHTTPSPCCIPRPRPPGIDGAPCSLCLTCFVNRPVFNVHPLGPSGNGARRRSADAADEGGEGRREGRKDAKRRNAAVGDGRPANAAAAAILILGHIVALITVDIMVGSDDICGVRHDLG